MPNLYWPVYKRLESELISMTTSIKFDDDQMGVYSDKFLELLIRTSIEIEAISKDLYLKYGGEELEQESEMYFDTVCLDYLEKKFNFSKKRVMVNGIPVSFFKEENNNLTPLKKANKRGTSGAKWKQAYQAVKHNRSKNYKLGNMKNCISAMAALYLLNLYYKDDVIQFVDQKEVNSFDQTQGSDIFCIMVSKVSDLNGNINIDEGAVYCINYTKEFVENWEKKQNELNRLIFEKLANEKDVIDAINAGKLKLEEIFDLPKVKQCISEDRFSSILRTAIKKIDINHVIQNQKFYAYLNKEK